MIKKYWYIAVLLLILAFGFNLRSYHIDYPTIGYHNMKEAHTLGEIYYGSFDGNMFTNSLIYTIDLDNPEAIHMDNFPLLSFIIAPLWAVFGTKLWIARLVIILFSMGCIVFTYLLTKELFNRQDIALLSAFFTAIMPLLVFFGRQVQYDTPALFFMLGSAYFFVRWRRTGIFLILFSAFFVVAGLLKLPFLIILLPILVVFPWKRLKDIFKLNTFIFDVLVPMLTIPLFMLYANLVQTKFPGHGMGAFKLGELYRLFTMDFWRAVYLYAVTDNFTTIGLALAGIGLVVALIQIKKWQYRFLVVWAFSYIFYAMASPIQQTGHSYYQIPFAPLVAILISLVFVVVAKTIEHYVRIKHKHVVLVGLVLVAMAFMWGPIEDSIDRQYDTQFFGLDIAGEYLEAHMLENETFMGSGHQSRGVNWHAKRRSYDFTTNVTRLQEREEALNITHLFLYQWGFDALGKQDMLDYIQQNYHLAQIAFIVQGNDYNPIYAIFAEGCCYNHSNINSELEGKPSKIRLYELTGGRKEELVVIDVVTR